MSVTKVIINSADRLVGSASSTDFTIKIPTQVTNVKYFCLSSAIIPNCIYNIRTGVNNSIPFRENATNKSATITPGAYNVNQLLTEIGTQMTTTSGGFATFSAAYDSIAQRITITSDQNFELKFATSQSGSAYRELGYLSSNGVGGVDSSAAATSHIASAPPNLALPYNLFINITEADNPILPTDPNNRKFSYVMNMSENNGNIVYQNVNLAYENVVRNSNPSLTQLSIRLCYADGSTVSLSNMDWVMVLDCIR